MKQSLSPVSMLFLGTLLSVPAAPLLAQQPQTQDPPTADQTQASASPTQTAGADAQPTPELKPSPTKALQDFEPSANAEYQLGPGDEISLDFPGRPDLAMKRIVGPDGRITIPLAGAIKVADETRSQAAKQIEEALSPYYKDLTATVDVEKYGSNRVIILGNVEHPGVLYFDDQPTLLDVIARGGLMASTASTAAAGGSRDGLPERCAIYRGNDQVLWVDLKSMLTSGSAMADLRLKRNDVVFIPAQQQQFVSVLGAVQHPGAIVLSPESTLISVLAQAGGPADGAGRNVYIVQSSSGKTTTIAYKDLMKLHGGDEIKLQPGDLIYMPKSGFYNATYFLERISPAAYLGTVGVLAAGIP